MTSSILTIPTKYTFNSLCHLVFQRLESIVTYNTHVGDLERLNSFNKVCSPSFQDDDKKRFDKEVLAWSREWSERQALPSNDDLPLIRKSSDLDAYFEDVIDESASSISAIVSYLKAKLKLAYVTSLQIYDSFIIMNTTIGSAKKTRTKTKAIKIKTKTSLMEQKLDYVDISPVQFTNMNSRGWLESIKEE